MTWDFKERRIFDRVWIPSIANIFVDDGYGNRLGRVRMLGRGGLLVETARRFPAADTLAMTIVAERDDKLCPVQVVQRYTSPEGYVGFEFQSLDPGASLEIAALISKYSQAVRAGE